MLFITFNRTALIISLCLALASCGSTEERQAKYLKKAQSYFDKDNFEKSRIEVKNALQINPKNVEARILFAKILRQEGEYQQSFGNFYAIMDEYPNNVDARIEIVKILFAGKQDDHAREHIDKILELEPKHKDARVILAGIESRQGHTQRSIELAQGVLAEHPHEPGAVAVIANSHIVKDPLKAIEIIDNTLLQNSQNTMLKLLKIRALSYLGDKAGIEKTYQKLIHDNPKRLAFYLQLARHLTLNDQKDKAETVLRDAIKNNPEQHEAKQKLVQFAIETRDKEHAEGVLKELIADNPDNFKLKLSLANLFISSNKLADTIALYDKVIEEDKFSSDSLEARNGLIAIYLSQKNRPKAEKLLQDIFEIEPSNAQALITRARLKMSDKELKSAIVDLRAALKTDGESKPALTLLAQSQEQDGSPKLALDNYRKLIAIDNANVYALIQAGRISIQENQINQAIRLFERSLQVDPKNATAVGYLGRLYAQRKEWDKIEAITEPLLNDEKTKLSGLMTRANSARAQGRWEEANRYYQQCLTLEPRLLEAVSGHIDYLLTNQNKGLDDAQTFLLKHVQDYPEVNYNRELLARIYLQKKEPQKAMDIYASLIKESPNNPALVENLAKVYLSQKNHQDAKNLLSKGIENNPGSIKLHVFLANLHEREKEFENSRRQYEKILSFAPKSKVAKNNLANLLVNYFASPDNNQRALELASGLADSRQATYLDTLGWVHHKMGNHQQAISYIQAAIQIQPDTNEFHFHLGMALLASGDKEKAKTHLEMATESSSAQYPGFEKAIVTLDTI